MDEMARATDVSVHRSLTASFAPELANNFKVITIKIFLTVVREVVAEQGRNVLEMECGNICEFRIPAGEYILMIHVVDFDNGLIREPTKCEKRVQRVFLADKMGLLELRRTILC